MKFILGVFLIYITVVFCGDDISCVRENTVYGKDVVVYSFNSEDDCDKKESCEVKSNYGTGCWKDDDDGQFDEIYCYSRGKLKVNSNCEDGCSDCKDEYTHGRCNKVSIGSVEYFTRVDGCSYGRSANTLAGIGGGFVGIGIIFFLCCCYLCIPFGIFLCFISCCVACC